MIQWRQQHNEGQLRTSTGTAFPNAESIFTQLLKAKHVRTRGTDSK